jgi:hypothetical protein
MKISEKLAQYYKFHILSVLSLSLSLIILFVVFIPRFLTISLSSYLISDIPDFSNIDKMGLTISRRQLEQLER